MKKVHIFYFNLVEIALAIAIIAIGISQILVLFPVGLNTNKEAIADNNIANIAEFMINYLRAEYITAWDNASDASQKQFSLGESPYDPDDAAAPVSYKDAFEDGNYGNWKPLDHSDAQQATFFRDKDNKGVFLFQQKTYLPEEDLYVADASIIAQVYEDNKFTIYVKNPADTSDTNPKKIDSSDTPNMKNYIRHLVIELSWPAEAPASQRERRWFRFEVFNENSRVK